MRATPLVGLSSASAVLLMAAAGPAAAADTAVPAAAPGPSTTISTAGTSFLTATTVRPGQPVRLSASTGDYLYWSFAAAAGQSDRITVKVALPPGSNRHGAATWIVDVFDGLRRRQACTAGPQTATAATGDATVSLSCTLRQIRSWADPWSGEPLPGTYYLRLSATDLPEQDLGLPIQANLRITARDGAAQPDNATLKAPLSPAINPGTTLASDTVPSSAPSAVTSAPKPMERAKGWFFWPSTRWWWTLGGGVLAALTGMAGYSLTRHPRRWFSAPR
jgi:hypothetical protein